MKKLLLALIRRYRRDISPYTPPSCRFVPTCSAYALEALVTVSQSGYSLNALEAVEVHGAVKGGLLALRRIARCHPFHREKNFIYDPVPPRKDKRNKQV